MLTPKQLDDYPETLVRLFSQVENDIIADMAKRISAKNMFIPAAQWQFEKLVEMGNVEKDIIKRPSAAMGISQKELETIMQDAGYKSLKTDISKYNAAGLDTTSALQSTAIKQAINSAMLNTGATLENITRTTAINATQQFYNALDVAYLQVTSGAFDYNTAIENAIRTLTDKGLKTAEYVSGHVDYLDVAVRRAVLTGVNQASLKSQDALADEMGSDLVEVTAHAGARVGKGIANHAEWQGKVYSRSGTHPKYPSLVEKTGYGTGAGLGGWNCRHNMFPFFEGGSERVYTDEELKEYNGKNYTYNGVEMTEYEAVSRQRYIERQIRKYKREVSAFKAAGIDTSSSAARLSKWQKTQRDFIEQTGLKRDYAREQIFNKKVAKSQNSGIINTGAISGALNPYSKKAEEHAKRYYQSVRRMKTDTLNISKATGISQDKIDKIKRHIFITEHDLLDGRGRFAPSYDMSQSWQRLINGNFIEQDVVLLKHEYAELRYMEKGFTQCDAHIKASRKYNYAKYCD